MDFDENELTIQQALTEIEFLDHQIEISKSHPHYNTDMNARLVPSYLRSRQANLKLYIEAHPGLHEAMNDADGRRIAEIIINLKRFAEGEWN